ncbi:MAG: glycosyltransferase [Propionibacteriaceae bacterium]|nr:glycosyltransferase [Propionibacteriaceae bacterium]
MSVSTSHRIAMVSMHTSPLEAPGSADAGGMNIVEYHAALALAKLGYEVDLLTRRHDMAQPDTVEVAPGVRVLHLRAGPARTLPKSDIDQYIPEFSEALEQVQGYDLYHSHHWMSGVAALDLARNRGVPHVTSFHSLAAYPGEGLSEGEQAETPNRLWGEARLAQESDQVIAISAAETRTVIDRCGANPDIVTIIAPGVDLDLFRPQPKLDERPYLAFAARLHPLKGVDLAITSLAMIAPEIRPRLVISGADSMDVAGYADHLKDLVRTHGLNEDVSFIGPQSRAQLAELFSLAALVLIPSYSETFGLVALEAAACGTPVVASATGGLMEAVVHGETGQLMDSRESEYWARAISLLLTNPEKLTRMGTVARVHARRFTWDLMARRISDVYESLIR